jgi:hypothetical protein
MPDEVVYDSRPDTQNHIARVQELLNQCRDDLLTRASAHDLSKLEHPEKEGFDAAHELRTIEYGTPEYEQAKLNLGETLTHHYAANDHHPEHYENGVNDMNLLAVLEMLMDWKAATERMKDGDIYKSIEINAKRFSLGQQLVDILNNTVRYMGW